MITLRRPSDAALDQVAVAAEAATPTYREDEPRRYRSETWSRPLKPTTTWEDATAALDRWAAHRGAGVRVRPDLPPRLETAVALAFRVGPVWVVAPCPITNVVARDDTYGFAYATLPGHPEEGMETFTLRRDMVGGIAFEVGATSRPADLAARLAGPVGRVIQHHVTARYLRLNGLA